MLRNKLSFIHAKDGYSFFLWGGVKAALRMEVDPDLIVELSKRLGRLNRMIEERIVGMRNRTNRLISETSYQYSEHYVQATLGRVKDRLNTIYTQAVRIDERMRQEESTLRQAAATYRETDAKAKAQIRAVPVAQWSKSFGGAIRQTVGHAGRAANTFNDRIAKHPLVKQLNGLLLRLLDSSLKLKLKPYQDDPKIGVLLRQLSEGMEADKALARRELMQILNAFDELARSQTAYMVYQAFKHEAYMKQAHQYAEQLRSGLNELGVSPRWHGPDVNLARNFTGNPLLAIQYNPLKTDYSEMPTEQELRFVIGLSMINEWYRGFAIKHYDKMAEEVRRIAAEKQMLVDAYNRMYSKTDIEEVQQYLIEHGVYKGAVTGKFDEELLKAVEQYTFMVENGTEVDEVPPESLNPFAKAWNSLGEIWQDFMTGLETRSAHKFDSIYDFSNYLTIGILDGVVSGANERADTMLESPSWYTIGDWLTLGTVNTVDGTFNPDDPLSKEHLLNSFGLATAIFGGAKSVGAGKKSGGTHVDKNAPRGSKDIPVKLKEIMETPKSVVIPEGQKQTSTLNKVRNGVPDDSPPKVSPEGTGKTGAYNPNFNGTSGQGLGKLDGKELNVSQKGLDIVKSHLSQFGDFPENTAMIKRLEDAMANKKKILGADASFYMHEVSEATKMKKGIDYDTAHAEALQKYDVSPFSVYHPDVIKSMPENFGRAWKKFLGIDL